MNIGFVVQKLAGGGAERVVSVLCSEFARMVSYECSVLIFFPSENEYATDSDVRRVYLFDTEDDYRSSSKAERIKRIRNAVKGRHLDAVFPFLWFVGIYTQIACKGLDVKVVQTIRNNPAIVPRKKPARVLRNWALWASDGVFCQNREQYGLLPEAVRQKAEIVPNPVKEEFFGLRTVPSKNRKIVMFGRLEEQKNYPMMLRAVRSLVEAGKDLSVEIYGSGALFDELQVQIDKAELRDAVRLMGRTDSPADSMRDAALFVMTSSFEGMPNSLMEAMAAGLPCISTDCPTGPRDLIEDGVNGYLVAIDDDRVLAERIDALLADGALRDRLGAAGREKVSSLYRPRQIAEKLVDCFLRGEDFCVKRTE